MSSVSSNSLKFPPYHHNLNDDSSAFYDKIKKYNFLGDAPDKVARYLFNPMPRNIDLNEVVDFIFKECNPHSIISCLEALLHISCDFKLSSYDKIRYMIAKEMNDGISGLNPFSLDKLLQENGVASDEEKLGACYDLGYKIQHPYFYRPLSTNVAQDNYSLNFLWVNLNPQDRIKNIAQNIFGDGLNPLENVEVINEAFGDEGRLTLLKTDESIKKKSTFIYRLTKWAKFHPKVKIYLWYDSALVTEQAREKSFQMMKAISSLTGADLRLKDIRRLPNIPDEIRHSLHPGTPVYYRVDILKALIVDHMTDPLKKAPLYCVISDIDIEPMPVQQLFDTRTVGYLSSAGYVFHRTRFNNFENSFIVFNKENKNLHQIHRKFMIEDVDSYIAEMRSKSDMRPIDSQFLYRQYQTFRKQINESLDDSPRKIAQSPQSQFNFSRYFKAWDHQRETFCFIGNDNVPYVTNGRNYNEYGLNEGPISGLNQWRAEPLSSMDETP